MKTEDKDWLELIAGREAEGFTDKEKAFFSKVREQLIKADSNDFENFECSEEELTEERKKILQNFSKALEDNSNNIVSTSTDHLAAKVEKRVDIASKKEAANDGNPVAEIVINQPSFLRKYIIPVAMAASVTAVALTFAYNSYINSNYYFEKLYPPTSANIASLYKSAGNTVFRGEGEDSDTELLELFRANPEDTYKQVNRYLQESLVTYSAQRNGRGWDVSFQVSRRELPIVNTKLSACDLELKKPGFFTLKIIDEQISEKSK